MPDEPEPPDSEASFEDQPTVRGGPAEAPSPAPATPVHTGVSSSGGSKILGTIGDFEVLARLGQGGMGTVYRARQVSLGRLVALKVLPAQFEEDADFVSRFQREARLAASLNHPNLVRVYSSGAAEGSHFIAMELVEGETLSQRIKRGPLPMDEAVRVCLDVAGALQCGWQQAQLIHRDIKPSNIFLSHSGEVKLGDLGLAKSLLSNTTGLTHTGMAMGTPHYISPEQARGEKGLDFRADIYSLGCTLYQMLTGHTPYEGTDPLTVMHLHISGPPPAILKVLPGCPIPLARLVGKMMKKQRHERHQSYEDLIGQIKSVLASIEAGPIDTGAEARLAMWREVGGGAPAPGATPAPTNSPAAANPKSKTPLYLATAAGVVAVTAVAFYLTHWAKTPAAKPTTSAVPVASRALDGLPEAEALKLVDLPAAAVSPSPSPKISPSAEPWNKSVISNTNLLGLATREGASLRFKKGAILIGLTGLMKDGAIRVLFSVEDDVIAKCRLYARMGDRKSSELGNSYYELHLLPLRLEAELTVQQGGKPLVLKSFPVPPAARRPPDQAVELELRVVGITVICKVNGVEVGRTDDATLSEGNLRITMAPGALLHAVQTLDLK